jgi:hypothetical protein
MDQKELERLGKEYYTKVKPKLMKDFDRFFKAARPALAAHFNDEELDEIEARARAGFEAVIPKLPYIGGKKNSGTSNLTGCAALLAIVRAAEPGGLSLRDTGYVIYQTFENFINSRPAFILKLGGRMMGTRMFVRMMQKRAEVSQQRLYPGNFVNRFIIGDGTDFDFEQDVEECAVKKYIVSQGAEKYLPYFCLGDYPMFRAFGVGFSRTQTLAGGGSCCDFRFKTGGETGPGWPPENLSEWKK